MQEKLINTSRKKCTHPTRIICTQKRVLENVTRRLVDEETSTLPFMKSEGSLPCSHESRTSLKPEPAKSIILCEEV
jgi:hypothetical protein